MRRLLPTILMMFLKLIIRQNSSIYKMSWIDMHKRFLWLGYYQFLGQI
jgi:hypothetical protein